VLPQRQPEVHIERLDVVKNVPGWKPLPIDKEAVILRIVDLPSASSVIPNLVAECDRAILFPFLKHASGCMDASIPQYQRSDYCCLFFSHAFQHRPEPAFVNNRIVF